MIISHAYSGALERHVFEEVNAVTGERGSFLLDRSEKFSVTQSSANVQTPKSSLQSLDRDRFLSFSKMSEGTLVGESVWR